jgi:hypothetical protein
MIEIGEPLAALSLSSSAKADEPVISYAAKLFAVYSDQRGDYWMLRLRGA